MTYRFFCRFFHPATAAWVTALWFAFLLMVLFMFSSYEESPFVYVNF